MKYIYSWFMYKIKNANFAQRSVAPCRTPVNSSHGTESVKFGFCILAISTVTKAHKPYHNLMNLP